MLRHRPGFTLIETLIYTAFVGLIMVAMTMLAYTAFTVRSKVRASLILQENMRFAAYRVTALVTEASAIATPAAGASTSTLVLTMPTAWQNPTSVTLASGTLFLTQGATGTAQALTSDEVTISALSFARVSSTIDSVRMAATGKLRNASAAYASFSVTTTASVRR